MVHASVSATFSLCVVDEVQEDLRAPRIARIDPNTGRVTGIIDLSGIANQNTTSRDAVLNGIAWDAQHDRLFVTGKLWPRLYEIDLVPTR